MPLTLNKDQQAIIEMTKYFSHKKLLPCYQSLETHEALSPNDILTELGEAELTTPENSEAHGEIGLDSPIVSLILGALAEGDFNIVYIGIIGSLIS